jgi:tetratricopeptide (TPR) repeat protein
MVLGVTTTIGLAGCTAPPAATEDTRGQQQMVEAHAYLDRGLLDSALAAFGLALEENTQLTDAHLGMGHIYREHDNYDLAEKSYKRATDVDPTNFDAHYYLGLMRQLGGKFEAAITAYLQALTINPDSLQANRDIAAAYVQTNATFQALPYALRATQLNADDQNAWYTLATTYALLHQYENAVDAYRQAAELGELADPVLLGLADAHLKLNHYQRAINVLRMYMRRTSDPSSTAYERLGYAMFKLRRFEDALKNYRTTLELSRDDLSALNGAGACMMTMYIQGDREQSALRDEAVRLWRRSVRLDSSQSRIIDLLSRFSRI